MRVLITGGAGFIGSHTSDLLLERGHEVVALDSLDRQVHPERQPPSYLDPRVQLVIGDVRKAHSLAHALKGVDAVLHLAARVGVGQSMSEIASYVDVNALGTARLLEALPRCRLVVASSMSVYGEGHSNMGVTEAWWDFPLEPASIYAQTKLATEQLSLIARPDACALRYFNVYGPRQALTNPYTGVGAIFSAAIQAGKAPMIYEDGQQTRDFVHVSDVARANVAALEGDASGPINIGTGVPTTIRKLAWSLCEHLDPDVTPNVTHRTRKGDVRHCWADISRAKETLGYEPHVSLEDGIADLAGWVAA